MFIVRFFESFFHCRPHQSHLSRCILHNSVCLLGLSLRFFYLFCSLSGHLFFLSRIFALSLACSSRANLVPHGLFKIVLQILDKFPLLAPGHIEANGAARPNRIQKPLFAARKVVGIQLVANPRNVLLQVTAANSLALPSISFWR